MLDQNVKLFQNSRSKTMPASSGRKSRSGSVSKSDTAGFGSISAEKFKQAKEEAERAIKVRLV